MQNLQKKECKNIRHVKDSFISRPLILKLRQETNFPDNLDLETVSQFEEFTLQNFLKFVIAFVAHKGGDV